MKGLKIEGKTKGKFSWFTVSFLIFKISIANQNFKKFSLRFAVEWGWD